MTSLLKAALEGEIVEMLDTQSPKPVEDKDIMELKGPLSEVFSKALAKAYARNDPLTDKSGQDATPGDQTALESQANDALAIAQLVNDVQMSNAATPADGNALTVYGVAANDVKPENIVEVSQDLAGRDLDASDFILVMDATNPSVNGTDSGTPDERVEFYGKALEGLAEAYGVKVYPSLEAFAEAWVADKKRGE
jgi:hypothetical protein